MMMDVIETDGSALELVPRETRGCVSISSATNLAISSEQWRAYLTDSQCVFPG